MKLSIIIPVLHLSRPKNARRFFMPKQTLDETLKDLVENVKVEHEIIVVCNGTEVGLQDFIKRDTRISRYSLNSVNVGVSRAWNIGAQLAEGEILCFLNDDVSVGLGSLEMLVKQLEVDATIGEIGPAGSYWKDCQHHSFMEEQGECIDVDVVSGFCFLVRRSVFDEVGGFDVAYSPAGFEEIDFSYKLRKIGKRCVVNSLVNIKHFHHHGVSAQRMIVKYLGSEISTEDLHIRNKAYFVQKWNGVFN